MKRVALIVAVVLVTVSTTSGQIGPGVNVFDASNFAQNSISAVQSVLTTIQTVLIEANQILDLTPVDNIIVAGGIAEDLAILGEILSSAELVWYDLQSLESQITALFGLENAPDSREGLEARLLEIKQFYQRSLSFAMRTQTLLMTMFRTIEHLNGLLEGVGALIGNMQGQQVLVQTQTTTSKTLAVLEAQTAAWQRVDTVDRLSKEVIIASLHRIDERRWESWPRP